MPWRRRSSPATRCSLISRCSFKPRGFPNRGIDASVVANGTYFTNDAWLPAIGYQADRELRSAGDRRKYGLAARPETPLLDDVEAARRDAGRAARIAFEAVVGTGEGQSRRRAREVAPDVDGRRTPLLPLRDRCSDPESTTRSSPRPTRCMKARWNDSLRSRSFTIRPMRGTWTAWSEAYRRRWTTTRSSSARTRTASSGSSSIPAMASGLTRFSGQHLVRGRVLSAEPRRRSAGHRSSFRSSGA